MQRPARRKKNPPSSPLQYRQHIMQFAMCALNPAYFIDNFCMILEPRSDAGNQSSSGIIPFRLYNYQSELVNRLAPLSGNFLIEKSRQMGLSWLLTAFQLWAVLFRPGFTALNVSRKEDEVDDRTARSLFGKLRFMYDRLPEFLKPEEVDLAHMRFAVPENDSFIRGESANDDAGRGGTFTFLLLDEAAHIDRAETMWLALRQTAQCIVLNSTPNGKGNLFARIRFDKRSAFERIRVHWKQHPNRDENWFARQTRDMTEEEIAQELEISYEKSKKDRVYREFDYNIHISSAARYNPDLPLYTSQDFGIRDPWVILWLQTDSSDNIYVIDEYTNSGEIVDHYAGILRRRAKKYKTPCANYGDPAGNQQSPITGSSIIHEFRSRFGIRVTTTPSPVIDGITAIKRALQQNRFFVSPDCTHLIDCLHNYRYADTQASERREEPLHNWASHAMDALRYFFVNRYPLNSLDWHQ
ncbi:MAG: hypothetical protein ABIH04_03785 [Planctomycetota bacterium]